jgi:hypothetical protein
VLWKAGLIDRDGASEPQRIVEDECTQAALTAITDAGFVLMPKDQTGTDDLCQASPGIKGETVSAPAEPLQFGVSADAWRVITIPAPHPQADIVADAALMKALGSVAWLAGQEYREDHSGSALIAVGLLRELRDGYERIAELKRKPTLGLRTDAMDHLGNVLSFFADLDEGDRCRAFTDALEFFNSHHPDSQIQGEPGFTQRICLKSPLGSSCRNQIEEPEQSAGDTESAANSEGSLTHKPLPPSPLIEGE